VDTKEGIIFIFVISIHTGAVAHVCTHFLNMRYIILVNDDNVIFLS